jgi:hypothetical protein
MRMPNLSSGRPPQKLKAAEPRMNIFEIARKIELLQLSQTFKF